MGKRKRKKKNGWRAVLVTAIALAAALLALTAALRFASYGDGFDNSVYRDGAFAGKRVLVLVPHEDDDIAMAGGTIRLYVDGGAEVYVAFATNGDNGSDADTRVSEAIAGLSILGVPESNILLLGYGDSWDYRTYKHIYHAPGDAVVASAAERTQTFGARGITDFHSTVYNEPAAYTRDNFVADIRNLLVMLRPDVIFCVDLDSHTDHAGLSWLFEEALGTLLPRDKTYRPKVYKGYAYSIAWFGAEDFYADNVAASQPPDPGVVNDPRFPLDMPCYSWAQRVRFPMPREALSYTLRANIVYRALAAHASQDARFRAANILNGDTVFFERRTDSLLYGPNVALQSSSGDAACLSDFKLVDTSNILDWPIAFDSGVWRPEASDPEKRVSVAFPARVDIASVSLYDDYAPERNIESGVLTFSDGSTVAVGPLHPDGQETRVTFPVKRGISSFSFAVTGFAGDTPGLSELAAYAPEAPEAPAFLKLMVDDASQDFLYRYTVKPGRSYPLSVYAYPSTEAAYTVSVTETNGDVVYENGVLSVRAGARPGGHTVTVRLVDDPSVFDTVEIVVPGLLEIPYHRLLSLYERLLDRVEYRLTRHA